ncbi:MAG: thioredoxin family protein [Chloroflexota bacterium]|nr:thioredoxin family protein [Chloroflexota bacterium]
MLRKVFVFWSIALSLAACAGQSAGGFAPTSTPTADSQSGLQIVSVASEIVVGPNRFAVGLIDPAKGMIHDASVHFRYFDLSDPSKPALESEADAVRYQTPDGETTYYAQEREFKRAGDWGVEVQARMPDGTVSDKRIGFRVLANSPTLKVGAKPPALKTRTAAEVDNDLHKLSSATTPNPAFYRVNLAQAITSGKPTVLLFATPAFCQTRMCGPAYDVVSAVQQKYGDGVNFIHVEVYTGLPNPAATGFQLDPAMHAFGLTTEPWVFLIDKNGVIAYRVEGPVTEGEIEQHLQPLLN